MDSPPVPSPRVKSPSCVKGVYMGEHKRVRAFHNKHTGLNHKPWDDAVHWRSCIRQFLPTPADALFTWWVCDAL